MKCPGCVPSSLRPTGRARFSFSFFFSTQELRGIGTGVTFRWHQKDLEFSTIIASGNLLVPSCIYVRPSYIITVSPALPTSFFFNFPQHGEKSGQLLSHYIIPWRRCIPLASVQVCHAEIVFPFCFDQNNLAGAESEFFSSIRMHVFCRWYKAEVKCKRTCSQSEGSCDKTKSSKKCESNGSPCTN